MKSKPSRQGNVQAMLRLLEPLTAAIPAQSDPLVRKRRLLADLCRLIGEEITGRAALKMDDLPPRMEQTLRSLLKGDSEKQVATQLGLSRHTVHVYVKKIYRKYEVSSRGELLAKWLDKGPRRNGDAQGPTVVSKTRQRNLTRATV